MQGLGKPGVHQCMVSYGAGMPRSAGPAFVRGSPEQTERIVKGAKHNLTIYFNTKQGIPKTLIQQAILNPPITFWGSGAIAAKTEDQFVKYSYPIPAEEGGTEIRMIWTDTPCRTTCWNDGNKTVEALRSRFMK